MTHNIQTAIERLSANYYFPISFRDCGGAYMGADYPTERGWNEFAWFYMADECSDWKFSDIQSQMNAAEKYFLKYMRKTETTRATIGKAPWDVRLAWGDCGAIERKHNSSIIRNWIYDRIAAKYSAARAKYYETRDAKDDAIADAYSMWANGFDAIANIFQFAPARENPSNLAFYESRDKYQREIRTSAKPAKALRKAFPIMDETDANAFAVWFKDACAPIEYTILQSKTRAGFRHAYEGEQSRANDYDSRFGFSVKPLNSSCMRYPASWWKDEMRVPAHPAEAYASGDFKIIWAEDNKGKIAARVVVYCVRGNYEVGPIYTLSNNATDAIIDSLRLDGLDVENYDSDACDWQGARMLAIKCNGGDEYAMPYVDVIGSAKFEGDYFRLSHNGDVSVRETRGKIYARGVYGVCDCCGDELESEYDACHTDCGDTLCESCYSNRFIVCDCCGENHETNESTRVYIRQYRAQDWCENCRDNDASYSESFGEFVSSDCGAYVESVSDFIPDWELDQYTLSDKSCEYFPSGEMLELPNGETWHHSEVRDSGNWILTETETGAWVATLKPHLEIDESGNVINRQIELPLAA